MAISETTMNLHLGWARGLLVLGYTSLYNNVTSYCAWRCAGIASLTLQNDVSILLL